jgi:hypothetical protein
MSSFSSFAAMLASTLLMLQAALATRRLKWRRRDQYGHPPKKRKPPAPHG